MGSIDMRKALVFAFFAFFFSRSAKAENLDGGEALVLLFLFAPLSIANLFVLVPAGAKNHVLRPVGKTLLVVISSIWGLFLVILAADHQGFMKHWALFMGDFLWIQAFLLWNLTQFLPLDSKWRKPLGTIAAISGLSILGLFFTNL